MTPPTEPKPVNPEGLANQLFDLAILQFPSDPRRAGMEVVRFLTDALFYSIASNKIDVIVYLTERLIVIASQSSPDEASRKELLKNIGDTIANAPQLPVNPEAAKP